MKVLIINGSPRENGNTAIALKEMVKVFEAEGVETEIIRVGNQDIRGCIACGSCFKTGKCVFQDLVNETALWRQALCTMRRLMLRWWRSSPGCFTARILIRP